MTEQTVETEQDLPPMFNALDRCDRCGAQAKLRAIMPSSLVLLFCNHHGNKYKYGLEAEGAIIESEA
jgi:hypothetical protein